LAAGALAAALLLKPYFGSSYFLLYLLAVLVSARTGGRSAGLLAAALTSCAVYPAADSANSAFWVVLSTYVLTALIVTYLASAVHELAVRWEGTLSSIGDGIVAIDRGGCVRFLNPAAEAMTGWTSREARNKSLSEVVKLEDEITGEPVELPTQPLLEQGKISRANHPKALLSRDGHRVWVEESSSPIRTGKGKVHGAILVFRDVTARREAQAHASQSQKMEAVGRLATGAAGDFNNLLTVITGYSEMLRSDLAEGNHLRRFADEIYLAADRAAGLSRQLLTLGQKQSGAMKVQDLNSIVASMETLLRRLLGNRIELVLICGAGPARVKADAAQIEQVIVNLAMNSRDAMPGGGRFVIEISNLDIEESQHDNWPGLTPGAYVALAVSDTGSGMDAQTRAHLFEPFFTTKNKGQGSGLGLSTVYGIVQQSGGHINVYSQLGAGTIFEIFLPREKGAVETFVRPATRAVNRGSETVLIADDEDGVRKLMHAVLATHGYNVLEARDGAEALALFESHRASVDIVVTDIMMPNLTGFEVGDRLHLIDPDLRVLYVSGYRDSPIGGPSAERELAFLHKPFTPHELLGKVRELLDHPQTLRARGTQA
jgi:PAS domain S-box-containing protein